MKTAFPSPGGGMTLDRVQEIVEFCGNDVALLIGGDPTAATTWPRPPQDSGLQWKPDLSRSCAAGAGMPGIVDAEMGRPCS